MALFYHIGRILLCATLALQGLYIIGLLPNSNSSALQASMIKGIRNFNEATGNAIPKEIVGEVLKHIYAVSGLIGGLLLTAVFNVLSSSKFWIKMNILGLVLLTLVLGVPYNVINGKADPLDPTDKTLFHTYANLALIGGLLYYHSTVGSVRVERIKRD